MDCCEWWWLGTGSVSGSDNVSVSGQSGSIQGGRGSIPSADRSAEEEIGLPDVLNFC